MAPKDFHEEELSQPPEKASAARSIEAGLRPAGNSVLVDALKPGGLVLDLQVIRPNPRVEVDGEFICEIDGGPRFRMADAATAAVDALVASGRFIEEAVDDHEVLKHYANGIDVIDDCERTKRRPADEAVPRLRAMASPCAMRERCRLRRLRSI